MTNFSEEDWKKIVDDFKLISSTFKILKDSKHKNSELFDIAMDLVSRELDRLFLDLNQIYKECNKDEKFENIR